MRAILLAGLVLIGSLANVSLAKAGVAEDNSDPKWWEWPDNWC